MASIDVHLRQSAERNARNATEHYVDGDVAKFAVAAGAAVEHALKSRLARESPIYLAEGSSKNWFHNARMLWNARADVKLLPPEVRTITAQEAFDRVVELDSACAGIRTAVTDVMNARNSQAHMGLSNLDEARKVFAQFARAVETVLAVSGPFWAPHENLVRTLLDDLAAAVVKRVEEKLATARLLFERRFGTLPPELRAPAVEFAVNAQRISFLDDTLPTTCPACGSPAMLGGTNRVESIDTHSDYPSYQIYLEAMWLRCSACALALDGEEELEAAGVDLVLENNEVDLADLFGDYEPDEDYFRGR